MTPTEKREIARLHREAALLLKEFRSVPRGGSITPGQCDRARDVLARAELLATEALGKPEGAGEGE